MSRVIVIGAGITGMSCARELISAGLTVSIRERAGSVGGRMASPRNEGRRVDIGAAYFTASDPAFVAQTADWCARGLARPWTDRFPSLTTDGLSTPKEGPWRYATPGGLRSLVADLASAEPVLLAAMRAPVSTVEPGPMVDGEPADAVVLAMPDPQARRILDPSLTSVRAEVTGRRWESALALIASYPRNSWPAFDGAFINDNPTLRWIADDGARRGDGAPVLVAHSTTEFAASYLSAPQAATSTMVMTVDQLLHCGQPSTSRVHRWTYARPADSREQTFFFGADRIGLAGDGWGSPRVETAWLSGRALGRHIAQELAG